MWTTEERRKLAMFWESCPALLWFWVVKLQHATCKLVWQSMCWSNVQSRPLTHLFHFLPALSLLMKSNWASWQVGVSSDVIVHYVSCNRFRAVQMPPFYFLKSDSQHSDSWWTKMPSHFQSGFFCLSPLSTELCGSFTFREKSFRDLTLIQFLLTMVWYQHFPLGKGTSDTFFPYVVCVHVWALRLFLLKQSQIYVLWESMFCCSRMGYYVSMLVPLTHTGGGTEVVGID